MSAYCAAKTPPPVRRNRAVHSSTVSHQTAGNVPPSSRHGLKSPPPIRPSNRIASHFLVPGCAGSGRKGTEVGGGGTLTDEGRTCCKQWPGPSAVSGRRSGRRPRLLPLRPGASPQTGPASSLTVGTRPTTTIQQSSFDDARVMLAAWVLLSIQNTLVVVSPAVGTTRCQPSAAWAGKQTTNDDARHVPAGRTPIKKLSKCPHPAAAIER